MCPSLGVFVGPNNDEFLHLALTIYSQDFKEVLAKSDDLDQYPPPKFIGLAT